MAEQSLKPIIDKLENLFSKFNEKFYGGELQKPIITVSPDTTKVAYGWCTSWKAWSNKEPKSISEMKQEEVEAMKNEGFYEINLCAEHLARPFEHVAETLLHEMVHLYNLQVGVQDTSRSGTYHNKKYKEAAEQHGLTVEKDAKYGWTRTKLNPEAKAFVDSLQDKKISAFQEAGTETSGSVQNQTINPEICLPRMRVHYQGNERSSCNLWRLSNGV